MVPLPGPGVVDQTSRAYNNLFGYGTIGITSLAEQAAATNTSFDFVVGPNAKVIVLTLAGISTSGTSLPIAQLTDAGGPQATGYRGLVSNTAGTVVVNNTGFNLTGAQVAAGTYDGKITLHLHGSNIWIADSLVARTDTNAMYYMAGGVTLDSECIGIRLTMVNGTDTFDAGSAAVQWE